MNTQITLFFGDGEHLFRFRLGEIEELQAKCDAGPQQVLMRLDSGLWRLADITETIRLGLIGGGMVPQAAHDLVRRYGPPARPALECLLTAKAALMALLVGVADDEPGKSPGPDSAPMTDPAETASGDFQTSMPPDSNSA
jgi:hypothetical protein